METKWRGLQAPGKEDEKKKWPYLVNNGRTNIVGQNAYLDQDNEFVMDRTPYPFIQMNPQDMADLKVKAGDLVEIYNDDDGAAKGNLHAIRQPEWGSGQRGFTWCQRTHLTELQTDPGRDPQTLWCSRKRAAVEL
jgi:anaerobic selenocysteine-containing dehydrogenase